MDYPVTFTVEYPERLSRGLVVLKELFGWLYVGIPLSRVEIGSHVRNATVKGVRL